MLHGQDSGYLLNFHAGSPMNKPSKPLQLMRGAIENHLTMLTLGAIVVGVSLRYFADPHGFSNGKDILKELGNFILITFVVAFIYENFVNYRYKHEFIHEIERILSERFNLPITKVYLQRPELSEKVELMIDATKEIIELGTALRTFVSYMQSNMTFHMPDGQKKGFQDFIIERLRNGVNVACMIVDSSIGETLKEFDSDSAEKLSVSLKYLTEFDSKVKDLNLKGKFSIITYHQIPRFAAICIDGDDPVNGKMLMSPYIPQTENAKIPAYLIEKSKNREIFDLYFNGIVNSRNSVGEKSENQS